MPTAPALARATPPAPSNVAVNTAATNTAAANLVAVLVHGTRTSGRIWDQQLAHLADIGIPAVAIDLPGHGARQGEPFTMIGAHEAIRAAIDTLPAGTDVILIGLSLGGYVVLNFAAVHPRRIVGVVAAGCSSETQGKPLTLYGAVASATDIAGAKIRGSVRRAGVRVGILDEFPAPTPEPGRPGWSVVTQMLTALAGMSVRDNLRAIAAPVWLVSGARCPLRFEAPRLLRARPDAHRVVIPGAGHDVNTDAPDAFNKVLTGVAAQVGAITS